LREGKGLFLHLLFDQLHFLLELLPLLFSQLLDSFLVSLGPELGRELQGHLPLRSTSRTNGFGFLVVLGLLFFLQLREFFVASLDDPRLRGVPLKFLSQGVDLRASLLAINDVLHSLVLLGLEPGLLALAPCELRPSLDLHEPVDDVIYFYFGAADIIEVG